MSILKRREKSKKQHNPSIIQWRLSILGACRAHPAPHQLGPRHLAERIRAEQAALEARGATDGERKTITVLFVDLRGSTALIEGLDPEDARAINETL